MNDELEKVPNRPEMMKNNKGINLKKYRVETQGQSPQKSKEMVIKFRKRNLIFKNRDNKENDAKGLIEE